MNSGWQQQKLRKYCSKKGIFITAYSPLGGQATFSNPNPVMTCHVLKQIAGAKGKTVAQVLFFAFSPQHILVPSSVASVCI